MGQTVYKENNPLASTVFHYASMVFSDPYDNLSISSDFFLSDGASLVARENPK